MPLLLISHVLLLLLLSQGCLYTWLQKQKRLSECTLTCEMTYMYSKFRKVSSPFIPDDRGYELQHSIHDPLFDKGRSCWLITDRRAYDAIIYTPGI